MNTPAYDSTKDTNEHIHRVQTLLQWCRGELQNRALDHDKSKLQSPEKEAFDVLTPRLKGLTYGSEEYRACLREMKPALDHHYAANRHHPEHFANGIEDMNLFDVIEMLMDWKAASERHDNGDIYGSIAHNLARFGMSMQLAKILENTADYMGWPRKAVAAS